MPQLVHPTRGARRPLCRIDTHVVVGITLSLFAFVVGPARAQSFTYTTFDAPGSVSTTVSGLNNAGQIIGQYRDSSGAAHGFLREIDGSFSVIAVEGATATVPTGINNRGQIVGYYTASSRIHSFVRDPDGSVTSFDVPGTHVSAVPYGINDNGEIVGERIIMSPFGEGFKRSADGSTYSSVAVPGAILTRPHGINNRGEIAGEYLVGSSYGVAHGFLLSADGSSYTLIDPPGTVGSAATGINNSGQIVFGASLRDADGTYWIIDAGLYTSATAINDKGQVAGAVGVGALGSPNFHGFIALPSPTGRPLIRSSAGVVPALAFAGADAIAPGSWIEIYGENLSTTTRAWRSSDFTGDVAPTAIEGVTVSINGQPAYLSYVSPSQVNAQAPSSLAAGPAEITVTNNGRTSNAYSITVNAIDPGLLAFPYTFSRDTRYILALLPDGAYVLPPRADVPSRRAKPGDTITLFGIGFGPVIPSISAGRIASHPAALEASIEVLFSGVKSTVVYAGPAPGFVGLYQLNVIVPSGAYGDGVSVNVVLNGNVRRPDGSVFLITAVEQ